MVSDTPLRLFYLEGLILMPWLYQLFHQVKSNAFTLGFEIKVLMKLLPALSYTKHLKIADEVSMFPWTETRDP